jgi:hypothetical protein
MGMCCSLLDITALELMAQYPDALNGTHYGGASLLEAVADFAHAEPRDAAARLQWLLAQPQLDLLKVPAAFPCRCFRVAPANDDHGL